MRSGTSELRVETGRWELLGGGLGRLLRCERKCQLCFLEVEDVIHLLLRCPEYTGMRLQALEALELDEDLEVAAHASVLKQPIVVGALVPRRREVEIRMLKWLTSDVGLELYPELVIKALNRRERRLKDAREYQMRASAHDDPESEDDSSSDSEYSEYSSEEDEWVP